MGSIDFHRGPSLRIVVPDNPWSTIYDPDQIRRAIEPIELGLGARIEWDRYVDLPVGPAEKDPVTKNIPLTILGITRSIYGPRLKRKR